MNIIRLYVDKNSLYVDASEFTGLLEGSHRIFFQIALGMRLDNGRKSFVLQNISDLFYAVPDIINYLRENNIDFMTDNIINNYLDEYSLEQRLFDAAKSTGEAIKKAPLKEIKVPSFKRKIKSFQLNAIRHMSNLKHSANFSVPGSGKTTIVYATFAILKAKKEVSKLLVIGPRSCFQPWEEEYNLCFGRQPRSLRLTGSKKLRFAKYFQSDKYEIFLCTYQTACNDLDMLISLCKKNKVFLILDESHSIKKFEGGVWADAVLTLAPYAKKRAILSGTPMPNALKDIWTQFTFLWPLNKLLGEREAYYYLCEERMNEKLIQNKIAPFFVRICKSDLNLPPQKYRRIILEPSSLQKEIYTALAAKYLKEIELSFEERKYLREWRKARVVRLIQAASNPSLLEKYSEEFDIPPLKYEEQSIVKIIELYSKYEIPSKIKYAIKLASKLLKENQKVIVWTTFVHNIKMLSNLIKEMKPLIIYGAIPRDENENVEFNREQQIQIFKQSKKPVILIANPAACAESISLHKVCHHAIYLDRTFNCGQYMQSLDRIHRVGLEPKEYVYYHLLICANTIDETIDRRLLEKLSTMNSILEDKNVPLGAFDIEPTQLAKDETEELDDFLAVIDDLKKTHGQKKAY